MEVVNERLREVVDYFNEGISENNKVPSSQIARQFRPLNLSKEQVEDLTAFLDNGLRDPIYFDMNQILSFLATVSPIMIYSPK